MKLLEAGRAWAYSGVALGAVASVAGNVAHSYIAPKGAPDNWQPPAGLILSAAFWPLALMIAVEVLIRSVWPSTWWVSALRYLGVGTVAVVAAVISYQHMSGLLRHYQETQTAIAIGPLAIDGLMLVSTAALLVGRHVTESDSAEQGEPITTGRAPEPPAPTTPDPAAVTPAPTAPHGAPAAGSAAKPDPQPLGKATAGSTPPTRSDRPATGADPIGSGEGGRAAPDPDSDSDRRSTRTDRPDPTDRIKGSDEELLAALRAAVKVGTIIRPLTEASVRSVVVAGGPKARELRNQINDEQGPEDVEPLPDAPAMDGDRPKETARG